MSGKQRNEQPPSIEESVSVASKIVRAQAGSRLAARGGLALMGATAPKSSNSTAPEPGTGCSAVATSSASAAAARCRHRMARLQHAPKSLAQVLGVRA
jgi:hypothetical protein